MLLSEVWRWTGDDALVAAPARAGAAGARLDRLVTDGFISYKRRTERGLENQSWKDSGDSQRFADGRIALPPIAPVEVQGYAYDAKRRTAELAREVWGDAGLAERLERDAADLQRRFDEAYWTRAGGTTRSRSTATARRSTRSARTSATCSGAGSSRTSGSTRSWRP